MQFPHIGIHLIIKLFRTHHNSLNPRRWILTTSIPEQDILSDQPTNSKYMFRNLRLKRNGKQRRKIPPQSQSLFQKPRTASKATVAQFVVILP
jgi:hypothetical protein